MVQQSVIKRIKSARYWSLIADETTDRHKREQMAIAIRYVLPDAAGVWNCYEDPISVKDMYSEVKAGENIGNEDEIALTGEIIGRTLLKTMEEFSLDLSLCVGQGYDGASTMSGKRVGAASTFKKHAPHAHYFHCAMHCLNLSASKVVSILPVQHAQEIVRDISTCFRSSAKRTDLLKACIDKSDNTQTAKKQLTSLCETRFIERHTAVITFRSLLPYVMQALSKMKTWHSSDARKTANLLENSICKSEFIVSLLILEKVSSLMLPVTRGLQKVECDIVEAMSNVTGLLNGLKSIRSEEEFSRLFAEAKGVAEIIGEELIKPRTASRSVYRPTAGTSSDSTTEEYYRINYYYPTLDMVIADTEHRFGERQQQAVKMGWLIPSILCSSSVRMEEQWEQLESALDLYTDLLLDPKVVIKSEFKLWREKWKKVECDERPTTALSALNKCSSFFPNIHLLLQLLATLPITTAEAERMFSKLERTLTAIRSTMEENRLEALILLQVHRTDTPTVADVINKFAQSSARRLKFII